MYYKESLILSGGLGRNFNIEIRCRTLKKCYLLFSRIERSTIKMLKCEILFQNHNERHE